MLFYNYTFITLNFIRPILEKYSKSTGFQYSTLLEYFWNIDTLLYSSIHFYLNTLLYSGSEISVLYPTLPRSDRPSSVLILWKSTKAEEIFLENQGITVEKLASELDVIVGSALSSLKSSHYNTAKFELNRFPVQMKLNYEQTNAQVLPKRYI